MTLIALSAPPQAVVAVLLFVVGGALHALDRAKWGNVCVAAGLAAAFWPW